MFDPAEFATVAETLHKHAGQEDLNGGRLPSEGSLRSSYSRGYYSVLLTLKAQLQARNFSVPEAGIHGKIRGAMKDTDIRHWEKIENKLKKLQLDRETADYDLNENHTAQETIAYLRKCYKLRRELNEDMPDDKYQRLGEVLNRTSGRRR